MQIKQENFKKLWRMTRSIHHHVTAFSQCLNGMEKKIRPGGPIVRQNVGSRERWSTKFIFKMVYSRKLNTSKNKMFPIFSIFLLFFDIFKKKWKQKVTSSWFGMPPRGAIDLKWTCSPAVSQLGVFWRCGWMVTSHTRRTRPGIMWPPSIAADPVFTSSLIFDKY